MNGDGANNPASSSSSPLSSPFPLLPLLLRPNLRKLLLAPPLGRVRGAARRALNLEGAPQEETWDEVRKITSICLQHGPIGNRAR